MWKEIKAQYPDHGFKHLSVEKGLSQSSVFAIYKDQTNFMWFGTRRGLNRFDGVSFKYFIHDPNDTASISSDHIQAIIGDQFNNLLIQTDRGINYYDRVTERFFKIRFNSKVWKFTKDNQNQIWGVCDSGLITFSSKTKRLDFIKKENLFYDLFDIAYDGNKLFWITNSHGVICFNISTLESKFYPIPEKAKNASGDYFIAHINGKVWVCADNRLFTYHPKSDQFIVYKEGKILNNLLITSFCKGFDHDLLIGTDGNGLLQFNTETHVWNIINHVPDDDKSLSGNTIYSLFTDSILDIVWIGQYMAGIDYRTRYSSGFNFLYHKPNGKPGIINNNIRCLHTDKDQNVWIGTRQGITVYTPSSGESKNLSEETLLKAGLSNPIITKLWQSPDGYIWICSYKGGIVLYNPKNNRFSKPEIVYPKFNLPNDVGIFDILLDRNNNLWIATGNGTFLFPQNKNGFKFHNDFAKCIIEDRAGRIFIGTVNEGVVCVNTVSLQFISTSINSLLSSANSKRINSIFEDSKGNIWIGTGGGGIYCYNPNTNKEITVHPGSRLFDKYISAVTEDRNLTIWITTYSGLIKYAPASNNFKNIFFEEGIKGKEFNPSSITQTNSGQIFAGTTNGLLFFEPSYCKENHFIPTVVFTNLLINNQKVSTGKSGSISDTAIEFNKTVTLPYNQNTVSLEYTAPDYYFGDKINFFYKINELSSDWIPLGNRRYLDFFKLTPGNYTITLKAENSDGLVSKTGTSLTIIIKKPFWKTYLAMLVYLGMTVFAIFLIRKTLKARLRLKYQIFLEKADKAKQQEINKTRLKFFSDISHEISTFLTVISLPIDTLNKMEDDSAKRYHIEIVNRNLKRLQLLVNRIVHLREIECGKGNLMAEEDDIAGIINSLQNIEDEKEIPVKPINDHETKDKNIILYIEKNSDLRHIIMSKLSESFRFIEANDMETGILKAKSIQPALILSDVNLASSESLDFCRQVKNDIDISHIPLVIITLQENTDEQIEGLKAGADAYVTKPISIEYLTSVINNQIESRKKLKLAFHTNIDLPNPSELTALDEKFLRRAYKIMEDNLSNANLGIPEFIKAMGTSKYMLYTKLALITGQTPNEFIMNYKLKKAASMLRNSHIKDIDIYLELGFNDLSYFRKCFKKQFGVTPAQFIRSVSMGAV